MPELIEHSLKSIIGEDMTPGQRIKLIKESAKKLSELGWSDINLTLRAFGLDWTDLWDDDDKYAYCLHFVEKSDNTRLLQLHAYLFEADESHGIPSLADAAEPWQPGKFRLFLSHVATEKRFTAQLKTELAVYGIDGFVAHQDIKPTLDWQQEIEKALNTSDALAALLHEGFHTSKWTDQEVGIAIARRILIVPIMVGETPYGFMGRYQGFDCRGKDSSLMAGEIFSLLSKHQLTSSKITSSLLSKLEDSTSFDEANKTSRIIRRLESWTPEDLRRLETAKDKNGEVAGGYSVPGNVSYIIQKYGSSTS